MLKKFLFGFGFIAIILTIIPFLPFDFWWIRMFDFPHVQLTVLTAIALLFFTYKFNFKSVKDYSFVTLLSLCFLFQVSKIYPYTVFSSHKILESSDNQKETIKILTANVLQKNNNFNLLIDEIQSLKPDVLLLTEVNQEWINKLKNVTQSNFSNSEIYPLDNAYGIALYSKYPLINTETKFLVADTIPSIHTKLILKSGDTIQLYAIHPTPPILMENKTSTDRDAEMMMIAKKSMEQKLPVIVCGDFNDVAWSKTSRVFERVSQLLDPRKGRGTYNTYNAKSFLWKWPLDHIFVSSEFRIKELEIANSIKSDHYPLYTEFTFEPDVKQEQQAPKVSDEDLKFANEQIENFLEEKRKNN